MSDRQIHYGLLNNPPLKHASKPDSLYDNTAHSYSALVELLTRMRLAGKISFDCIGDETRPITTWHTHREVGAFVAEEIKDFLRGYWRDLLQSQPNHIEIVVEKNTVAPVVRPVAERFCITMTSGRGFCSLPPRYDMAQRFRQSGKTKLVVLFVTDFDPDGEAIAESYARSMRDDFGIESIHPIKVALTHAQITRYRLPRGGKAKATSSRTKGFVAKYGKNVWELEALAPQVLQEIVTAEVECVLDLDAFAHEERRERDDAVQLHATREAVREALAGIRFGDGGST